MSPTPRWTSWLFTLVAILSVVPQWVRYAGSVETGDYGGTVDERRVDALLRASTATIEGGPFATVPRAGRYSVAPDIFNDLGTATLVSVWTNATGRQATTTTLGYFNLAYLAAGSLLLIFAVPARLRLGLAPVFLLVDLVAPRYRSADTVAIHGSLAALAAALPLLAVRAPRPWLAIFWGLVLFAVHKTRSAYGIYALLALLPMLLIGWARFRDRGLLIRAAFLLLGFFACEVPWRVAVQNRLSDPRVIEKDALSEHNVYEPLISGIGWTDNPWRIKPWDPWVAQFLADTVRGPVVAISTRESERRAKLVFFSLARQRPLGLLWLYLRRIPGALGDYSIFGAVGAGLWIGAALLAFCLAWARRDRDGVLLLLSPVAVAVCLVLQTIVIDTRYIYAHPLGLVSAVVLAMAVEVALFNARPRAPEKGRG